MSTLRWLLGTSLAFGVLRVVGTVWNNAPRPRGAGSARPFVYPIPGWTDGVHITENMVAAGAKEIQILLNIDNYRLAAMVAKITYAKMRLQSHDAAQAPTYLS